jgi:hypothetical protein
MRDILLFLGSGASAPFGLPTMKKLVDMFQEYLSSHSFSYEDYSFMKSIYSNVKDIICDTYGYADLESVFTVIESLSHNIEYKELGFTSIYVLSNYGKEIKNKLIASPNEQKAAIKLLQLYKDFVRSACKEEDTMEDHITNCYKELFDMLGDKYKFDTVTGDDDLKYRYGPCSIYTTNYDSVIERYWKGVSPIMDLWKDDKGITVLDPAIVLSGEMDVKLVKLHGSLDWFKLKNGRIVNLPSYRAKHGKSPVEGEMILYPLHQKDLYLYPWFELFKGFKHDLSKTKTWISIGYSFNDEFIRNIFHEALNDSVHKFVIVAPDANGIVSDKFSNYEDYIRKINGKFGETGTVSRILNELNS